MFEGKIEEYILSHISPEPPFLAALNRETHLHYLYSRMCSGHLQGRILKMLTAMILPKQILELGTFTGYSALCFAEGMPADAHLHTVEIEDELEEHLTSLFEASSYAERIHLHIGNALDIIPSFTQKFDMVFIDADKRIYKKYYDEVFPKVNVGGYILADNTLWDGKIVDMEANHDAQSLGISEFNDFVVKDPRVETVILPLRDGLTVLRKISD